MVTSSRPRADLRWWLQLFVPGDATRIMREADIRPGKRYVLLCRVSGREQRRRRNLERQAAYLTRLIEEAGGKVLIVHSHTGSGWRHDWLAEPARLARILRADLIALSADRVVRNRCYESGDRRLCRLRATNGELSEASYFLFGQSVETVVHPNAPFSEARSLQTRIGLAFRDGVTEFAKLSEDDREAVRELATELFFSNDNNGRETSRQLLKQHRVSVSHTAVRKWASERTFAV